jgi:hypothetical protein
LHVRADKTGTDESGYVAVIENTNAGVPNAGEENFPNVNGGDVGGLLVKLNVPGNVGSSHNFIQFRNAAGQSFGSVEGSGAGGVSFVSGNADYAEWLPRVDASEAMTAGDVIGVYPEGISKSTVGAMQVMVVSEAPGVLGNDPGADKRNDYEKVAFLGQVPVKVRGKVAAGDYLVPSGQADGVAIAIAADALSSDQAAQVVGRAWEASDNAGLKTVNAAVGTPATQVAGVNALVNRTAQLQADNNRLTQQLLSIEQRLRALETSRQ